MFALAVAFGLPAVMPASAETVTSTTTTIREPTGKLVITDEKTRSFRLGTETRVYTAPPTVDLSSLRDQEVKVYLDDGGQVARVTRWTTVEK
jgi:hypothetical protein